MKSKIGKLLKHSLKFFQDFTNNFKAYYYRSKFKTVIITIAWIIVFIALILLINLYIRELNGQQILNYGDPIINTDISTSYTGSDNFFINQIKVGISATAVVYDNFISYTPDPTGRSVCKPGSAECEFHLIPSSDIAFPSTNTRIKTSQDLTNLLLSVVVPIGFILISMQALNLITNGDNSSIKQLLTRSLSVLILMALTPYILSLSILLFNQLTNLILNGNSLTGFLTAFLDGLETNATANPFQNLIMSFLELGNNGSINPLSYLYALPVIVSLALVMLLLLFISFQFILRFLNLFFLATVYPVALIFGLHPATSSIVKSYWKQWVTFLIQQPVFVLGFVIMHKVLANMFLEGITLEAIIIFIAMLVFLGSINILAARVWGDVYSAVSQNITSAIAANELKSTLIDKPISYASQLTNWGSNLNETPQKYFSSDVKNPAKQDTIADKKNQILKDQDSSSLLAKELRGSGYDVTEQDKGKLNVSGDFYTDKASTGNSSVFYTTKTDAVKDGVKPTNIEQIKLQNATIQDASNKKMLMKYNNNIRNVAAANSGHAGNIGLSYKSTDQKVIKSMNLGRSHNLKNNIQGIGVRNDHINGDKSISGDNIVKLHMYRSVVNNSK